MNVSDDPGVVASSNPGLELANAFGVQATDLLSLTKQRFSLSYATHLVVLLFGVQALAWCSKQQPKG